jgi:hypothetical protein
MPDGERLSIPIRRHPSGYWIGIHVTIGEGYTLLMVLDSGSPQSTVSPQVAQDLWLRGMSPPAAPASSYVLTNLTASTHALPDLRARVLPRLSRLRVDGLLGLDFFNQFDLTCYRRSTMELLLER